MKKKLILLMLGMTRSGKTTKIAALSADPRLISEICIKSDATTPVTTDWELSLIAEYVSIKKIEINPKTVYGNIHSRSIEDYNKIVDDNPYLTEVLGLQKIESDSNISDPKPYVEKMLSEFVKQSSFETIKKIMADKRTSSYIRRLSILVPASENFCKILKSLNRESIILRDTRGIMDLKPEDVDKMPNLSMYDLGLDGVDAVLLMCSSSVFPVQAGEWYKKVYGECFKAVPVFLEARHDALFSTYKIYSELHHISIEEYLKKVNAGEITAFDEVKDTHFVHGLELLSMYGAASKDYTGNWHFNYSVFNMDNCLYLTPTVASLSTVSNNTEIHSKIFDNDGYKFFQKVSLDNMSNILNLVSEHLDVLNLIYDKGVINNSLHSHMNNYFTINNVPMYPNYQLISRAKVCSDIINNTDYLGPRHGITTQNHGRPRYLAAATVAATSHIVMSSLIHSFNLTNKLKDTSGNEIAPNMSIDTENKLIHMYLNKKLRNSTDIYAYFRNYTITDRNIVVDAIEHAHNNNIYTNSNDALTVTVDVIAKSIF